MWPFGKDDGWSVIRDEKDKKKTGQTYDMSWVETVGNKSFIPLDLEGDS
jgi:hypothetical protein